MQTGMMSTMGPSPHPMQTGMMSTMGPSPHPMQTGVPGPMHTGAPVGMGGAPAPPMNGHGAPMMTQPFMGPGQPMATGYGTALKAPPRVENRQTARPELELMGALKRAKAGRGPASGPAYWAAVFGSALVFLFAMTLVTFYSFYHTTALVNLFIMTVAVAAMILIWQTRGHFRLPQFGPWSSMPTIMVLMAVVLGSLFGLVSYYYYGRPATVYTYLRTYGDAVPSAPADAYSDAGRLLFSSEVTVDSEHSVGFAGADGNVYCIAPIRESTPSTHVEFWAVGLNCCGFKGKFSCDSAQSADGHAAAVVMDARGFLPGSSEDKRQYESARRKAIAMFGFADTDEALYVRWYGNVDTLPQSYTTKAWLSIILATLFYGLASGFGISVVISKLAV